MGREDKGQTGILVPDLTLSHPTGTTESFPKLYPAPNCSSCGASPGSGAHIQGGDRRTALPEGWEGMSWLPREQRVSESERFSAPEHASSTDIQIPTGAGWKEAAIMVLHMLL